MTLVPEPSATDPSAIDDVPDLSGRTGSNMHRGTMGEENPGPNKN
jgi:hypothetical protein